VKAAVIGAGVIGAGWVARFVLHGWDVTYVDQDRASQDRVEQTIVAARNCLSQLYSDPLPSAGHLTKAATLDEALEGVDWVQESVPEVLAMKQQVYEQLAPGLAQDVPIASSTSGFKPSELASGMALADQMLVCHPFNPVYLLPLVEVVSSPHTRASIKRFCLDTLLSLGMQALAVRKEIDAHIADRLLEAVWREALWLVKDGVATTAEIDDAIRFGFGPRWAQMGLFETYRIAAGEGGMQGFLQHFGPALQWPWSKLTDVPDLTSQLIEKIVAQSDAQSGDMSIAELEAQRDRNLVAIFRALKQTDYGVGRMLNEFDRKTASLKTATS
jgi:carnitine 3-dehydrogenase